MYKLAYGLQVLPRLWDDTWSPHEIEWFDTLAEAKAKHQALDFPPCNIHVYALSERLTSIYYQPYGIAGGYHYFGIHPDVAQLAADNGITDDVIMGEVA